MSKHDFVPNDLQKKQLAFLRKQADLAWAERLADTLATYMERKDHYQRACEAAELSLEHAGAVLESYNGELQLVHSLILEIINSVNTCEDSTAFVCNLPARFSAILALHPRQLTGERDDSRVDGGASAEAQSAAEDCPI